MLRPPTAGCSQTQRPRPRPSLTIHCPLHSKLRPPLDLEKKSRLLSICLHSVLALPLLDVLERDTCLFLEPPNIQVRVRCPWPLAEKALGQGLQPRRCACLGRELVLTECRPPFQQQQVGELKGAPQAPRELMASTQGLCSMGSDGEWARSSLWPPPCLSLPGKPSRKD